ncbi:MAG: thiamine-phosphate kinase [Candidatus Nanopelagicales bacterium]
MSKATLAEIGEFGLIELIQKRLVDPSFLRVGIGDDAAILDLAKPEVVTCVDILVEDQHFKKEFSSAKDIGHRAAAANLADLVATGAQPLALLLALAAPSETEVEWLIELVDGIVEEANQLGAVLIGGDTTRSDKIIVSITAIGQLENKPTLRSGAKSSDLVIAAGRFGWAQGGLRVLQKGFKSPNLLVQAHQRPLIDYQAALTAANQLNSMIDVSDGLAQDALHIAKASGVQIDLKSQNLIPDELLIEAAMAIGDDPLDWVLTGGDDHAFLATIAPDKAIPVGFRIIGEVFRGEAKITLDGKELLGRLGHDHFAT